MIAGLATGARRAKPDEMSRSSVSVKTRSNFESVLQLKIVAQVRHHADECLKRFWSRTRAPSTPLTSSLIPRRQPFSADTSVPLRPRVPSQTDAVACNFRIRFEWWRD